MCQTRRDKKITTRRECALTRHGAQCTYEQTDDVPTREKASLAGVKAYDADPARCGVIAVSISLTTVLDNYFLLWKYKSPLYYLRPTTNNYRMCVGPQWVIQDYF